MAENTGIWPSGHGQLTKIGLSDGSGGKPLQRQCKLSMIAMDLKAIWGMSGYGIVRMAGPCVRAAIRQNDAGYPLEARVASQ